MDVVILVSSIIHSGFPRTISFISFLIAIHLSSTEIGTRILKIILTLKGQTMFSYAKEKLDIGPPIVHKPIRIKL